MLRSGRRCFSVTRRQTPAIFKVTGKLGGEQANAAFRKGLILAEHEDWTQARSAFDEAVQEDPSDGRAFAGRAWCLEQLKQGSEALKDLRRVVQLSPDSPPAHVALAECLHRQGESEEAERRLVALLSTVGDYGPAVQALGQLRLDQNRPQEAADVLLKAPSAHGLLAIALLRSGKLVEAEKAARAAVAMSEDDGDAWATLGQILYQLENYVEAAEVLSNAVSRAGGTRHRLQRAAARLQCNRPLEALEDLKQAQVDLSEEPESQHILNLMFGFAHESLGESDLARPCFEKWLLNVRPGEEGQAEQIRARLKKTAK